MNDGFDPGSAPSVAPGAAASEPSLTEALRHYQAGRLDEAEALCREIVAAQPDDANALNVLGIVACRRKQFDKGTMWLRRTIAVVPGSARAHFNLGNALRQQGELEEAVASLRHAVAIEPGYAAAHCALGAALIHRGPRNPARRAQATGTAAGIASIPLAGQQIDLDQGAARQAGDANKGLRRQPIRREVGLVHRVHRRVITLEMGRVNPGEHCTTRGPSPPSATTRRPAAARLADLIAPEGQPWPEAYDQALHPGILRAAE